MNKKKKKRVGILGATGIVGYHLAKILDTHQWFDLVCLGSSPEKVGLEYYKGLPSGYGYHLTPIAKKSTFGFL